VRILGNDGEPIAGDRLAAAQAQESPTRVQWAVLEGPVNAERVKPDMDVTAPLQAGADRPAWPVRRETRLLPL